MSSLDNIITRNYTNFLGVDFTGNEVSLSRSPKSVNMWKSYNDISGIETRPGMKKIANFDNQIYGFFFYKVRNVTHVLVHSGTKLYEWLNYPTTPVETKILHENMNIHDSRYFIFDNVLFIMDGLNYLEFDGETCKEVEGTIPITSYIRKPSGQILEDEPSAGIYQPVNVLTPLRKNIFRTDGKSTMYQLDSLKMDSKSEFLMTATIQGRKLTEDIDFSVKRDLGEVTFNEVFEEGLDLEITYSKTNKDHKNRILHTNLCCEFDNRIFYAGNVDYPNAVFHSELNNPRYIRDTAYYECGVDLALVKAIIPGNGVLWVIKEINQNTSSVFYLNPTIDSEYGKIYPSQSGNVSLDCESVGINFNDDIVYFSKRGLESISTTSMYSEQILSHRSYLVDGKLLNESNQDKMKVIEYNGYLLCLINSHVYLADSRSEIKYEWFYWELPFDINFISEYRGNLYLGNSNGEVFELNGNTDNETPIESVWTTAKDNFGTDNYIKTTNKKGMSVDLMLKGNNSIIISSIKDGVTSLITDKANDNKGYYVFKSKIKKFKNMQLEFKSQAPFGIYSTTLQGFVSGYLKK